MSRSAARARTDQPDGGVSALIAVATAARPVAADLHQALAGARTELAAAEAAHSAADGGYWSSLLADEATVARTVQERDAAVIRRDRARALIETIETRIRELDESDAAARRLQAYEAARTQSEAVQAAILKILPTIGRQARLLLRAIAEAQLAIKAANADLPPGAEHLADPEDAVRSIAGRPRQVLKQEVLELWVDPFTGNALPEPFQSQIQGGRRASTGEGTLAGAQNAVLYKKANFLRVTYLPETQNAWAERLGTSLSIPGLREPDEPFWRGSWMDGTADPESVMRHLEATEFAGDSLVDPAEDEREPVVQVVPTDGTFAAA